ncbi:TonB-dependent receptor [Sandaracinobacter sp.]|jgi:iron complex outermembrane receptor protein|uniref:TonB-dependent receptor n=1 Tax=Sandaracinobacter sp. TaxID=2487581 RepID=UPI0035AE97FD
MQGFSERPRAAFVSGHLLLKASASAIALTVASAAFAQAAPGAADEDIVVTGFRASIANAIAEKKSSDMIVESISAEDIGKLPDTSIAESISRLPGLTSQRFDGRAQNVSIRGLAPDFSTTLLNGREQVTTSDNRGVEFDQFPSEIMQQVNVFKTPSAALIGAGLSGTVDLRTIRPLAHGKTSVALSARAEVLDAKKLNPDSDTWGYRFSGTYIDQFANDTMGIALSVTHLNQPSQIERFEAWGYPNATADAVVIGGTKPYARSTTLERTALSGAFEWQPSEHFHTTLDVFYSKFKDDEVKRGVELPLFWSGAQLQPGFAVDDGLVTSGQFNGVKGVVRNDIKQTDADLFAIGWNVEAGNDILKAKIDVSYSGVDRKTLDVETYSGTGRGPLGATDNMGFDMVGRGVVFDNQLDYADPALILLTSPQGWGGNIINGGQDGYYNNRRIKDELLALRFGAERELGGAFRSVEVGFNYTGRVKRLTPDEYFLGLAANTNGITSVPVPGEFLYDSGANMGFLGIGETIAYDVKGLLDSGIYTRVRNPNADVSTKGWRVREDVLTGYLQLNIDAPLGTSRLTGNVGVQLVNTDQVSNGLASSGTGSGVTNTPITDGASYLYALPTLNLALRTETDFVARLGLGRQMARARMDDMRASINYNYSPGLAGSPDVNNSPWSGNGGNPKLRPWIADSIDISFEKYFSREAYVSLAGYYKKLKTYIYEQNVLFDFTGFPVTAGPEPVLREGFVRIWSNGDGGELYGLEATGSLPFNVFSSSLDGFGVQGSYSYTESNIEPNGPGSTQPLPGLSKHVWNATGYFERSGFSVRGSVRHRSSFLAEVRGFGGGNQRRYAKGETIVDAQIGYEFQEGSALEGLSLLAQAYNLTNEPFRTYDIPDTRLIRDYESYGRRFLFGASYRF